MEKRSSEKRNETKIEMKKRREEKMKSEQTRLIEDGQISIAKSGL